MLTTRAQRWRGHISNLSVGERVGIPVLQPGAQGSDPGRIRDVSRNGLVFPPGKRYAGVDKSLGNVCYSDIDQMGFVGRLMIT